MSVNGLRRRGFTFFEILLSLTIMAVALAAVLSFMSQGMVNIQRNRLGLLAKTAASREMEHLRTQLFGNIVTGPFPPTEDGVNPIPGAAGTTEVCYYNPATGNCDGGDQKIKKVTVTVTLDASRVWRLVSMFSQPPS